mgnify:CR=1 FL=1
MNVVLRRLRADEEEAWRALSMRRYADDMIENAGLEEGAARRKADEDFARALPDGIATAGHAVFAVETEGGERVGHAWLADRELQPGRRVGFVYEIYLEKEQRGKGYGRAAMRALEAEAEELGLRRVELNVFGGNDVARALYRSLGYREVAVYMGKDLA